MRILIVNDDGIFVEGINVLADYFCKDNDVYIVAPDSERSGFSHSITLNNSLTYSAVDIKNTTAYSLSGTPVDCVKFAVKHIFKDIEFDLVLSGINNGPNLGADIMYSGTVAGASEGVFFGIPSIAVSLSTNNNDLKDYVNAGKFLSDNINVLHSLASELKGESLLNINYPTGGKCKGGKIVKTGATTYGEVFKESPKGSFRLFGTSRNKVDKDYDCDYECVKQGFVAVSIVKIDRNNYDMLQKHKEVKFI